MSIKLGKEIFSLNVGNAAHGVPQKLTKYTVVKVGRKYFTARRSDDSRGRTDTQFYIDSMREKTEYTSNHRLYLSETDWENEKQYEELYKSIRESHFGYCRRTKLSLDQLKQIDLIVNPK